MMVCSRTFRQRRRRALQGDCGRYVSPPAPREPMFSCCGEEQNLNTDVRGKILHRMRAKTQESEGGREGDGKNSGQRCRLGAPSTHTQYLVRESGHQSGGCKLIGCGRGSKQLRPGITACFGFGSVEVVGHPLLAEMSVD